LQPIVSELYRVTIEWPGRTNAVENILKLRIVVDDCLLNASCMCSVQWLSGDFLNFVETRTMLPD
jgi:hypothetical protein